MNNGENVETNNQTVQQPVAANQQIINTEAAKAKADELAGKAKQGIGKYTEQLKTNKNVLIATIAVVVVVIALVGFVFFQGGSKGVVKSYAKAMIKSDSKRICKLFHEDYIEFIEDYADDDCEDLFDDRFDELDDEDFKYLSYEIIDKEKYDKDKVEDYAESLEDAFDIDEDDVKAVIEYTVKFKVDDDGDKGTKKVEVYVVKIKGKWYLFS